MTFEEWYFNLNDEFRYDNCHHHDTAKFTWNAAQKAIKDKYLNTNPEDLFFKWRKKEYPHKVDIKYDSYAMEAFEAGWRSLWDNDHD